MKSLSRSQVIGVLALLGILVVITGVTIVRAMLSAAAPGITLRDAFPQAPAAPPPVRAADRSASDPANGEASPQPSGAASADAASMQEVVVVHVAGAVKRPGVYHLKPGARGEDALKAAGGPSAEANTDAIDLAARLQDGNQLYFPTREEQPTGGAPGSVSALPAATVTGFQKKGKSSGHTTRSGSGSGKPAKLSDPSQGQVNINTATAEDLQRLPGIGPAMAARILACRQHHRFQRVEDLLEISGIGDKKFAKLQPFVKVR